MFVYSEQLWLIFLTSFAFLPNYIQITIMINCSDLYKLKEALGIEATPAINRHTKTKHFTEFQALTHTIPCGDCASFNYHLQQLCKSTNAP